MAKEIPVFLKPTIFKLISNNRIEICSYKEFSDRFFIGFTKHGITLEIPIEEIEEIIEALEEIRDGK